MRLECYHARCCSVKHLDGHCHPLHLLYTKSSTFDNLTTRYKNQPSPSKARKPPRSWSQTPTTNVYRETIPRRQHETQPLNILTIPQYQIQNQPSPFHNFAGLTSCQAFSLCPCTPRASLSVPKGPAHQGSRFQWPVQRSQPRNSSFVFGERGGWTRGGRREPRQDEVGSNRAKYRNRDLGVCTFSLIFIH